VIAGQSKGQTCRIIRMIPKQHRAVVEGVNMVTKHQKPTASSPQGGLSQMEAPLHVSNLMLIDPKTGTPTRVGMKINDKGQKVRVAKKSGETIK
jgi:large subunit ribosomal protein L24